jgi:hypothetical protein
MTVVGSESMIVYNEGFADHLGTETRLAQQCEGAGERRKMARAIQPLPCR